MADDTAQSENEQTPEVTASPVEPETTQLQPVADAETASSPWPQRLALGGIATAIFVVSGVGGFLIGHGTAGDDDRTRFPADFRPGDDRPDGGVPHGGPGQDGERGNGSGNGHNDRRDGDQAPAPSTGQGSDGSDSDASSGTV